MDLQVVDNISDPELRKAGQTARTLYQGYTENRAKGMSESDALADTGFAILAASSAAVGPWGPIAVLGARLLYGALKLEGAKPEPLIDGEPAGTPVYHTNEELGFSWAGISKGPVIYYWRERTPSWLVPELQRRGLSPEQYWSHVVAHVPIEAWDKSIASFYERGIVKDPNALIPTIDYARAAPMLIDTFPYRPVSPTERAPSLRTTDTPFAFALSKAKSLQGVLGRLPVRLEMGSTNPNAPLAPLAQGAPTEPKEPREPREPREPKGQSINAPLVIGGAVVLIMLLASLSGRR